MHDIQILEPMSRSSVYDFTKADVEEMFSAMQDALDNAREEYNKKFEGKAKAEKKVFTFGGAINNNMAAGVNFAEVTSTEIEAVEELV